MKKSKLFMIAILAACTIIACACQKENDGADTDTSDADVSSTYVSDSDSESTGDGSSSTDEGDTSDTSSDSDTQGGDDTTDSDIKDGDIEMASKYEKDFSTNISVNSGKYTTDSNITYTASGHGGFSNSRFSLDKGTMMVKFSTKLASNFNKIILCYEATSPVKASAKYICNGEIVDDVFYLEAGKHTFSCLNSSYLEGKLASDLISISFTSILGSGEIGIYDIELKEQEVYDDVVYYLENDAYKLGIKLSWGGGICYLEDKLDTSNGLKNLINQYDTGRLIQQSYYGTLGESKYTPGKYNGTTWNYNPVQGGDVNQNRSRIIEIEVKERSIYIKAQPQDWALNGQLTPSYMENVYTLYSDRVQVDNRFMDFGYFENNPCREQELPAFYTLSYLDTFVYYGGSDSWSGASLSYGRDLPFWGSATSERNKCLFPLRESNRETWCAWINEKSDYGIGLYVPNVDFFLAGRHAFDGSKDPMSTATNYVAPLNKIKIVSGEAIEYSYIITTGSTSEIRDTFKTHKDFAKNESLHKNYISSRIPDATSNTLSFDFSSSSSVSNILAANATNYSYDATNKALKLTATDADVQIYLQIPQGLNAENYKTLTIEYMIPEATTNGKTGFEVFLCAGDTLGPDGSKSVRGSYTCDGAYHKVEISLEDLSYWKGNINHVRFDYLNGSAFGDTVYIKSISFT